MQQAFYFLIFPFLLHFLISYSYSLFYSKNLSLTPGPGTMHSSFFPNHL